MKRTIPLILVITFCLLASAQSGTIYQWVGKDGVMHFTNEPPPPGVKIVNETAAIPYNESADEKRTQEDQEILQQDLNQQEPQQTEQQEQQTANQQEQQAANQQESPAVETDDSDSGSNSSDNVEGVLVDPYVRNREQVRRYERRKLERDEIVTPLPRRGHRMEGRRR